MPVLLLRVLLDTNAFDELARDDETVRRAETAVQNGELQLVVTHVQIDEVNKVPDAGKRQELQRLTVVGTCTAGAIYDVSKFDEATYASVEDATILDDVMLGNPNHAEDALILLTARRESTPLVTRDKRLTKYCHKYGIEVITPEELLARIP